MERVSINGIVDFGNTRGKLAVFEDNQLLIACPLPPSSNEVEKLLKQYGVQQVISSKVGNDPMELLPQLRQNYPVYELSHQTPLPIANQYGTPETLGMDRLAAAVGAWALFPNQASLVIDLGTCITYDLINAQGAYLGGAISPGIHMRSKAMHHFTAKLPIASLSEYPLIGTSTQECLSSGIVNGIMFEIEGYIGAYREGFEIFNTVLCGGDAAFFETKLKAPIFVRTELVMTGLNAILNHLLAL